MSYVEYASAHTVTWIIPDYLKLIEKTGFEVVCADIPKDTKENRFELKMVFLGRDTSRMYFYYYYPEAINVEINMEFMTNKENVNLLSEPYKNKKVQAHTWIYMAALKKDYLVSYIMQMPCCQRYLRLKFYLNIIHSDEVKEKDKKNISAHIFKPSLLYMSHDFECLFKNGLYTDSVIESNDGTPFKVHKAILCSRSEVLKAHFDYKLEDKEKNVIQSIVETDVLKEMLNYMYSGRIADDTPDEFTKKLFIASDYYQIPGLKNVCEDILLKKLNVNNAIDFLILAHLHSALQLKQLILEYIRDGKAKLIIQTPGWFELDSIELVKDIYKCIL